MKEQEFIYQKKRKTIIYSRRVNNSFLCMQDFCCILGTGRQDK